MTKAIIPENRSPVQRLCRSTLLIVATTLICACGIVGSTASTPAARDDSPATATPAPANLGLAQSYERNGQYDEAIAAYEDVLANGTDADRQTARLALARRYLANNDYQAAQEQVLAYQSAGGHGGDAEFLLAEALVGLGQTEQALAAYGSYVDQGGVASANAESEMADLLVKLNRFDEAQREEEAALKVLPASLRSGILLAMAQELEAAAATGAALNWYARLGEESDSSDQALALERTGVLEQQLGEDGWQVDLQQVVTQYPGTSAASDALTELSQAGIAVDPYAEALVHYRHFENDEAMQAFQRYLAAEPTGSRAAAAHYYIAALDERLGDPNAALDEYAKSLDLDPTGDLADDALWWSGLILEKQSRWDEADQDYSRILAMTPPSTWADDAAFRHGLVLYEQKRYADAATAWSDFASATSDAETASHALYWAAKAEQAAGDAAGARTHLAQLVQNHPLDYYGLRAAQLLSSDKKATPVPAVAEAATDATSWLASISGKAPVPLWKVWLDPRWAESQELSTVGFPRSAAAELRDMMWANAGDPMTLWALAQAYDRLGSTEMSSRSAQLVLESLSPDEQAVAPKDLLRLAYPRDYMSLLQDAQQAEGVSPDVMLALIRQESFFDPLAGSGAGATGLTQVIPSTGQEIATDMGMSNFAGDDLLRPVVSISFGAHYLQQQLAEFNGNLYFALAAYNAGPGAAQGWADAAGGDVDLFLEQVDVGEANLYVRLVMQNLAVYRYLYEGAPRPSLPR
ncbi:MAG: transglycosylase SLT domain-containing protein [Dehalococcoidia bacterium]|jgi:soluble lytic murein transglycosylase